MRRYETIFILRPTLSEDEITSVIENTTQVILDEKGTIVELNKWGMKKLAYLIKKENQGYYVYCEYAGTPTAVAEIERKFRIDDSVLRYMTVKTAASISEEQINQAVGEVTERETASQELAAEADEAVKSAEAEKTTEPAAAEKDAVKAEDKKVIDADNSSE
ncbi:MAG: 30S ribosomal protein S6 [Deltaproteobacteria bacterium]|nr:30S ribosomal protein S6 [Deltaproteobacteria bacterium]MBW2658569.1 30S ribosomal protein S6 [Deltaproteobacteria bacterium]